MRLFYFIFIIFLLINFDILIFSNHNINHKYFFHSFIQLNASIFVIYCNCTFSVPTIISPQQPLSLLLLDAPFFLSHSSFAFSIHLVLNQRCITSSLFFIFLFLIPIFIFIFYLSLHVIGLLHALFKVENFSLRSCLGGVWYVLAI